MNHSFENQVTLVTGGASGIGLATARAFAEAGAAVALVDIDENAVGSAAEQLLSAGRKAIAARCDVSDEDAVAAVSTRPSPRSVNWILHSTMPGFRLPLLKLLMLGVRTSTA